MGQWCHSLKEGVQEIQVADDVLQLNRGLSSVSCPGTAQTEEHTEVCSGAEALAPSPRTQGLETGPYQGGKHSLALTSPWMAYPRYFSVLERQYTEERVEGMLVV